MTNADGNAGETSPSDPQPSEPVSSGYEAPSLEHSQDRTQTGYSQPSYAFPPPGYEVNPQYPPALDYPSDLAHDYPPAPPFGGGSGYPPPMPMPMPGYPPPPGYPGYLGGYPVPAAGPTNGLAIGSLTASILSLPMLFMCGIGVLAAFAGIGLGIGALNQIKQSGQPGRGMAIAGIAVGGVGAVLNGAWILLFFIAMFAAP